MADLIGEVDPVLAVYDEESDELIDETSNSGTADFSSIPVASDPQPTTASFDNFDKEDGDEVIYDVDEVEGNIPGPYRQWLSEHEEFLENKRAQSEKKREQCLENGRDTLIQLYQDIGAANENRAEHNREEETKKKEQRARELETGSDWERISTLIDLAETTGQGKKSKSRMRDLIFQLKN
eukprot:TRINITY_DN2169_c0_g1_i1.p1 TRINITY_DN2169_c0_g1~~TRINITY_DN2169_c0_g1_i1.p1  ORF type:complete len:181 (-),score=67.79 TRINITY_DN2169_c0_g1_i1:52-594(-)